MSIKENQLSKLAALKQQMDPEGKEIYIDFSDSSDFEGQLVNEEEALQLQEDFIREFNETASSQNDFEMDEMFGDLTGPSIEESKVEVVYCGGIIKKYVNISFDNLIETVTEEEFEIVVQQLKEFSNGKSKEHRANNILKIGQLGENVVGVIFQKCRIFELVGDEAKNEIVHLIAKLTRQNLNNRLLIKGILDHATSETYIKLAIQVAGVLSDKEMSRSIEKHLLNDSLFIIAFEALLRMRASDSVDAIIQGINQVDATRRDLVEEAIRVSKKFNNLGISTFETLIKAYANCTNRLIRPVYIFAIRSFGDEGLPKLIEYGNQFEEDHLYQIFKTIGGLRTPAATNALKVLLQKVPQRQKSSVIAGISSSGDSDFVELVLEELEQAESNFYRSKCLQALSNIGGNYQEQICKRVEPYLKHTEGNVHVDALNCLVRNGDTKRFDELLKVALRGFETEKAVALKALSLLPMQLCERLMERLISLSDEDAFTIITTLQQKNRLPRKSGTILEEKLKTQIPEYLRIEIYRIIARHEGTDTRILPDGFIMKALELEENKSDASRITRELRKMVKNNKEIVSVLKVN